MQISFHKFSAYAAALAVALLSGCATQSEAPPAPTPLVSTVPPLEQFMSDAERARTEGSRVIERETYRNAAQAYPTSKAPWLKLAEGYFEVHDYGNAILAAQEVLQRDPADKVASSLLAVSGLRVSASALSSMRQRESLGADTRQQAEDLVKTLREALGEPLLVPAEPPPPARRAVRRAVAPAPAAAAPAPAPSKPPANPFQSLIK